MPDLPIPSTPSIPSPPSMPGSGPVTPPIPPEQERANRTDTAQLNATRQSATNAGINTAQISALEGVISGIPIFGPLVKTVADGLYAALAAPPAPVAPEQKNSTNDPIKLFVFSIVLAILQFIWCFIKLFLHILPIIGVFVPICGDSKDTVQTQLNSINSTTNGITAARLSRPADPVPQVQPRDPRPEADRSKTFNEYTSNLPPQTPNQNSREIQSATNNTSANQTPNAPPEFYSEGIADADQLRRMFGLGPISSNVSNVIINKSNNK